MSIRLLLSNGHQVFVEKDNITILKDGEDYDSSLLSFKCQLSSLNNVDTIVKPNNSETLLAIYNKLSGLFTVPISNSKTFKETLLLSSENFVKDSVVFCDWHPLNAIHLVILQSSGLLRIFNTINGRVEFRMRINSPEDFTLKCSTANFDNEVFWVGLENGDILAISPVMVFPCKWDDLNVNFEDNPDRESTRWVQVEKWSSLLRNEEKNGIIQRTPKGFSSTLPTIQGPFLIQPEPVDSTRPIQIISIKFNGVKFLLVAFRDGRVDILILENPIIPTWDSLDTTTTTAAAAHAIASSSLVLTLVETIFVGHAIFSILTLNDLGMLIALGREKVSKIDLCWISQFIQHLSNPKHVELPEFKSSIFAVHSSGGGSGGFVDAKLINPGTLLILSTDGKITRALLPSKDPVKMILPGLQSLNTLFTSDPIPIPIRTGVIHSLPKITLPKLNIPSELKSITFPQDLNENSLETILNIITEWRLKTLLQCSFLAEGLKRRIQILADIAHKQNEWAERLCKRSGDLLEDWKRGVLELESSKKEITKIGNNIDANLESNYHHSQLSQMNEKLLDIQEKLQKLIPPSPRKTMVVDKLKSHREILDQIQSRIEQITIN